MNTKEMKSEIITILLGITVFLILDIFYYLINIGTISFIRNNELFTLVISTIVFSFGFSAFKKSSKSLKFCYIIIFLIGIINLIKINIMNEPLYLSDIVFIRRIGRLFNLVTGNLSLKVVVKLIVIAGIYGGILALLYFLSKKYEVTINNKKIRISIIIIDIVILIALFFPTLTLKNIYLKVFFQNDKFLDFAGYGTNNHYYAMYGCTQGTYGVFLNSIKSVPKDYNEDSLEKELKAIDNLNDENFLGNPNIIVVLSESFFDVDKISEVKFDKEITTNFDIIKESQYCVNTISPSYGGMSENAAFELLTGGNMSFFPKGYIPITWLYNKKESNEITSIVNLLKQNGYNSKTTFVEDYYHSEKSYKKMGFDEYVELNSIDKNIDYNDEYITNKIIEDLKNSNGKMFNVYSTFENHLPYNEEKYDNYDVNIINSSLSEEDSKTIRAYAQGIYNSDKQLGRLNEFVQSFEEPTIVVFLGDHLPFLYNSNYGNVLVKLNYFNDENDEKLSTFRKYNIECLVFSNYNMEDFKIPEYLGMDQILPYIVNRMDIKKNNFYKWLENSSDSLAGFNRYIFMDKMGNLFYEEELTPNIKDIYKKREMMQYKFFVK